MRGEPRASQLTSAGTSAAAGKELRARPVAYDLYIRGKVKAGSENTDDNEDAINALEAAVAIDPFFAGAYAQLARAYNTGHSNSAPSRRADRFGKAPMSPWRRLSI